MMPRMQAGVLPEIVDVLAANGTIRDAVLGVEDFLAQRNFP